MNRSITRCCTIIVNSKTKHIGIDVLPRFFTTLEITPNDYRKPENKNNRFIKECSVLNPSRSFHISSTLYSKDFYKILGISKNSSQRDIKKAYYELAKKHHPDANKNDPSAARKFQAISEAYEILGDAEKKRNYDSFGSASMNMGDNPFAGAGAHRGHWEQHQSSMDPEEFFRSIFGDFKGSGFSNAHDDSFAETSFGFGAATEIPLTVSFSEAARGVQKNVQMNIVDKCQACGGSGSAFGFKPSKCIICNGSGLETITTGPFLMRQTCRSCRGKGHTIKNPCSQCYGKGRSVQRRTVTVPVPAGVENGQSLRMTVGNQEVFIKIEVQSSNYFRRDGHDVHSDVLVSLAQAILGGRIKIRGIYEDVELDIPSGTHSHSRLRLRGKGIRRIHSNGHGDHYCHVKIAVPTYMTPEEKQLIIAYAELESDTPGTINGFTTTKEGRVSKQETEMLKQFRAVIDGTLESSLKKPEDKDPKGDDDKKVESSG